VIPCYGIIENITRRTSFLLDEAMSHKAFPRFRSGAAIATAETAVAQQGIPSVRPFATASPALSPPSGEESGEKEFLLRFFDLKRDPFSNAPEDEFFYTNAAIRQVYRELINALCERSGGAVLTGEAGVGKTTLLCRIRGELKAAGHLVIARYRAGLCFNELVTVIAEELQVPCGNDEEVGFPTRLREQLERNKCARPPILIIDDAEWLGGDVIRNLGRLLVGPADRSLRVLLSGRPELARRLELPVLAELRRMLLVSSRLERLDDDDAASYIFHRLRVADYRGSDLFLSAAINTVVAKSGGLPRQIDRLCTKSLTLAAATGKPVVTSEIVEQAAGELRPKDASPVEAAFAEAPAITIARRGWVNAVSNILIGRVRGARLPARAMTQRPAHLAQRHENTTSPLDLDALKYAPRRRLNNRPGYDTIEPEMPRHLASRARPAGGFIERPELSRGATRSETVSGRREIAPALQRPRSAFALLLGVIAGVMMAGGAVWLALSSGVGDRSEGASRGVRVALEPPSLALPAPTPRAATPSASITSPPAPATPTGAPPSVGPPTQPTELARLLDRQTALQYTTLEASPYEPELAQPTSTGSNVSLAENTESPAAPPPAVTLLPVFEPPTLAGPPLATASPVASPPASSQPTMDKRPVGRPAHLSPQPAPEKSAASAHRPMRTSERRSKSPPTKLALLEAPNMHPPTSLLPQPVVAHGLPVVTCRAYTSTHNLLDQPGNVRGVACREPGGQWTVVQETFN
jgi:MSHA biogenesis protein MshM